jgi:hypothetical protein
MDPVTGEKILFIKLNKEIARGNMHQLANVFY